VKGFEGITARHAAEIVANIFRNKDPSRADYSYWYVKWSGEWEGGRLLNEIPEDLKPCLRKIKQLIETHPWVASIVDGDFDIIKVL
jgi:hypothetical protein